MTLGEKIRALRTERGWSQTRLAAMVSVSSSAVCQWEAGKAVPGYDKLNALSSLFLTSLLSHGSDIQPSGSTLGRASLVDVAEMRGLAQPVVSGGLSYEPSRPPIGQAIAVLMPDNGMRPTIEKGDLLIIDQGMAPQAGEVVLALLADEVAVVRRLRTRSARWALMPENKDFRSRHFQSGSVAARILGVVVEIRRLCDR